MYINKNLEESQHLLGEFLSLLLRSPRLLGSTQSSSSSSSSSWPPSLRDKDFVYARKSEIVLNLISLLQQKGQKQWKIWNATCSYSLWWPAFYLQLCLSFCPFPCTSLGGEQTWLRPMIYWTSFLFQFALQLVGSRPASGQSSFAVWAIDLIAKVYV